VSKDDGGIDLEPEGGDKPVLSEVEGGGEIVAEGTPEDMAKKRRSYTGGYLKELLAKSVRAEPVAAPMKKKRSNSVRQREAAE
jgi:excinuclease ABC subunit A